MNSPSRRQFFQVALASTAPALLSASVLAMDEIAFFDADEEAFDWRGYRRVNAEAERFWITLLELSLESHSEISNQELAAQLDSYIQRVIENLDNKGAFCLLTRTVHENKPMIQGIVRSTNARSGPEALIWSLDLLRRISSLGYYLDDVGTQEKQVTVPLQLGRLQLMFPDIHQSLAESARRYAPSELDAALVTWSENPEEQDQRQRAVPQMREGLALLIQNPN
jgi:hypothetical protein